VKRDVGLLSESTCKGLCGPDPRACVDTVGTKGEICAAISNRTHIVQAVVRYGSVSCFIAAIEQLAPVLLTLEVSGAILYSIICYYIQFSYLSLPVLPTENVGMVPHSRSLLLPLKTFPVNQVFIFILDVK
jgi:hypothetical protein